MLSPARSSAVLREPVSRMQLVFDDDDDEGQEGGECTDARAPTDTKVCSSKGPQGPAPQDSGWDAGGALHL